MCSCCQNILASCKVLSFATKYSNGYVMYANFVFSHSVPLHMGRGRILLDFCFA